VWRSSSSGWSGSNGRNSRCFHKSRARLFSAVTTTARQAAFTLSSTAVAKAWAVSAVPIPRLAWRRSTARRPSNSAGTGFGACLASGWGLPSGRCRSSRRWLTRRCSRWRRRSPSWRRCRAGGCGRRDGATTRRVLVRRCRNAHGGDTAGRVAPDGEAQSSQLNLRLRRKACESRSLTSAGRSSASLNAVAAPGRSRMLDRSARISSARKAAA